MKKQKAREDQIERQDKMTRQAVKTNKQSDLIVRQTKMNKINEIFDRLDEDKDEMVSTHKMNADALGRGMLTILKPLLDELAELDEPLDRQEFVDAVSRLYEVSQIIDAHFIY